MKPTSTLPRLREALRCPRSLVALRCDTFEEAQRLIRVSEEIRLAAETAQKQPEPAWERQAPAWLFPSLPSNHHAALALLTL